MYTMDSPRSGKWRITFNSPVVLVFAAICVVATALNYITGGLANQFVFSTYSSSLLDPMTYVRLFTHVFGHAGWDHLIGNMSLILLLGPMLEEKYGSSTVVQIIALTALTTGIVNDLPFRNTALCGASGVCFAFILLSSLTSFREGEIPLTFVLVALLYLGQQVYDGIFVQDNISNLTHIVGGLTGAAFGFVMGNRRSLY